MLPQESSTGRRSLIGRPRAFLRTRTTAHAGQCGHPETPLLLPRASMRVGPESLRVQWKTCPCESLTRRLNVGTDLAQRGELTPARLPVTRSRNRELHTALLQSEQKQDGQFHPSRNGNWRVFVRAHVEQQQCNKLWMDFALLLAPPPPRVSINIRFSSLPPADG